MSLTGFNRKAVLFWECCWWECISSVRSIPIREIASAIPSQLGGT